MKNYTLMLADTESEKSKWVVALSELHRILKRNNLPNTMVSTRTIAVVSDIESVEWSVIAVIEFKSKASKRRKIYLIKRLRSPEIGDADFPVHF